MTTLKRTVRRVADQARDAGRSIVVSIEPPGLLGFRLKGCRRTYRLPIAAVYSLAVKAHVAAERRVRRKKD